MQQRSMHDQIRSFLVLESFAQDCERQTEDAILGVAADEDGVDASDWGHQNVIARYLGRHIGGGARVCVDYTGVTVVGQCDELLFDEELSWVELLLRALDIGASVSPQGRAVTREDVLRTLPMIASWQSRTLEHVGWQMNSALAIGMQQTRAFLQEAIDALALITVHTWSLYDGPWEAVLFLGRAIAAGFLPSPSQEYRLETLLGLLQQSWQITVSLPSGSLEAALRDVSAFLQKKGG
jgi:hypothetical protein